MDLKTNLVLEQNYVDTTMMHLLTMAAACYGRNMANILMSDPQHVVECIKVGLMWHKLLGIGQKKPLSIDIDQQLEVLESSHPLSMMSSSTQVPLSSTAILTIGDYILITSCPSSRIQFRRL
jgi:hypothetical protein